MSPLLIQGDGSANHMLPTFRYTLMLLGLSICPFFAEMMRAGQLVSGFERAAVLAYSLLLCAFCTLGLEIVFTGWWGTGLAMTFSKVFTSSPIQMYKFRGILRANWAPALVHRQLTVQ
jgi:hypothetical protein